MLKSNVKGDVIEVDVYRPTWVEISYDNIKYNYKKVKELVGSNIKVCAVVKANAYGHGAVEISKACIDAGADYLAVAMLSEAIELRLAGFSCPILILGWTPEEGYELAIKHDITLTIFNSDEAKCLNHVAFLLEKKALVHLKLDTGMSRLGFQADDAGFYITEQIFSLEWIVVEGIFSHLAKADEADKTFSQEQIDTFKSFISKLEEHTGIQIPLCHIGASACIIDIPEGYFDMVRPGIILYGYHPSDQMNHFPDLRPALTWKARVSHIKTLPAGRFIGYNGTFELSQETLVATIPVGYADGYNRKLSNNGYVICKGMKLPIIGKVCMDQFMIDASLLTDIKVGDEVILLGEDNGVSITATKMAKLLDTIEYEVLCGITVRAPRIYIN